MTTAELKALIEAAMHTIDDNVENYLNRNDCPANPEQRGNLTTIDQNIEDYFGP
jgi:hypothetical protein